MQRLELAVRVVLAHGNQEPKKGTDEFFVPETFSDCSQTRASENSSVPFSPTKTMTRTISLFIMLFVVRPVLLALDPVVSKATAEELVRDALASLGEDGRNGKIAVGTYTDYWAPDFITLQAEVFVPSMGTVAMRYFAVNPWTGDVWEPFGCTRMTSPTIRRKQEEIWKSSRLPDEARPVLAARTPACTPATKEGRREQK